MGRVVSRQELSRIRRTARDEGKRFVFTNGCFDILHRGHIELLTAARALGDILVVAINSDSSVTRLKGEKRPIVAEHDRAAIVAALESVDFVTVFEEDTPRELICALLPDVLVKGSDYVLNEIVGRREVEAEGGEVVRFPLKGEHSTEKMLRRIAGVYRDVAGVDGEVEDEGGEGSTNQG